MNSNISSASEIQLPSGFRFDPTEPELFEYYLIPKLMGEELPLDAIMDLDVYIFDPDQLPLNHFNYSKPNEAYFFTESTQEDNIQRATPSGYWKIYKENVAIFEGNNIIGFKNKFVFCNGRYPDGDETNWKMVEYRSTPSVTLTNNNNGNWVACKVRRRINVEEDLVGEADEEFSSVEAGRQHSN